MARGDSSSKVGDRSLRKDLRVYLNAPSGLRPLWFEETWIGMLLIVGGVVLLAAYMVMPFAPTHTNVFLAGFVAMLLLGIFGLSHGLYIRRTNPRGGIVDPSRRPGESEKAWRARMESRGHARDPSDSLLHRQGKSK